jgi:D-tyrosyl-tRNA(Tyr) deacylase
MRAVCQRVSEARVKVDDAIVGEIAAGLFVLLGVARGDTVADADRLAAKVSRLRIFEGDTGHFHLSLLDVGGAVLVVSQFTLIADIRKGNRPSLTEAAPPNEANALYERFCDRLAVKDVHVERGVFGARMAVELVNQGPVTIVLDT